MDIIRLNRSIKITGFVLAGLGVVSLGLNIALGGRFNFAVPMVFMMLGVAFFLLTFVFMRRWKWAAWSFIPGSILISLGFILLLNVITNDHSSWAYAWLLMIAGAGLGLVLVGRTAGLGDELTLAGAASAVVGLTFFVVFGVIAGGLAIRVAAPILLVLGGVALRWLKLETILPHSFLQRFPTRAQAADAGSVTQEALVEPLSPRELEVLKLIDAGLSNADIAASLTVAASTVKTHINNIYGKLAVETRTQALKRARELGIL